MAINKAIADANKQKAEVSCAVGVTGQKGAGDATWLVVAAVAVLHSLRRATERRRRDPA